MKHLKKYENLSYKEYVDILFNTPTFYPVFKLIKDYKFVDIKRNEFLLEKGLEIYTTNPLTGAFMKTLDQRHIDVDVDESNLEFVEYRNAKKVEEYLTMFNKATKYNL